MHSSKPATWLLVFICLLLMAQLGVMCFVHREALLGQRRQELAVASPKHSVESLDGFDNSLDAEFRRLQDEMSKEIASFEFKAEHNVEEHIPLSEEPLSLSEEQRQQARALAERLEQWSTLDQQERREVSAEVTRFWTGLIAGQADQWELSAEHAKTMAVVLNLFTLGEPRETEPNQ